MSAAPGGPISAHAEGALEAQRLVSEMRVGSVEASVAFDRLLAITDRYGLVSAAAAAFVNELAKRCR